MTSRGLGERKYYERLQTQRLNAGDLLTNNLLARNTTIKGKKLNKKYTVKEENLLWIVKIYVDQTDSNLIQDTTDNDAIYFAKLFNEGKYKDKSGAYDVNGNQLAKVRYDLTPIADFYAIRNDGIENVTITQIQEELSTGGLIFSILGGGSFTQPNTTLLVTNVVDGKVSNTMRDFLDREDTFGVVSFTEPEEINGKSVLPITAKYYKMVEGESVEQTEVLFGTDYELIRN